MQIAVWWLGTALASQRARTASLEMAFSQLLRRRNHRIHVVVPSKTDKEVVPTSRGEIEWRRMICYSQPTLLTQERCFQIVQPLNLWSPKSPDKNLSWGVLKLVVEIGGPICCPKNQRASDFNIGPNFEGVQSTNKLLSQTLSCHRKKAFGHLTKPTNVVLFSSLPMAVDCRWRSLLHELTQATTTGRRSWWSWGYVVLFFFTWHFGEGFFWDRNSSSCIFGFSGWWWSQLFFLLYVFFIFTSTWLNHQLVGPTLDVTVGFDDWLFGSRLQPAATHPEVYQFFVKHGRFHTVIQVNDYRWGYGRKARFNIL